MTTHIRCTAYRCTTSREACAARHTLATESGPMARQRIRLCRDCAIGEAHAAGGEAGEVVASPQPVGAPPPTTAGKCYNYFRPRGTMGLKVQT